MWVMKKFALIALILVSSIFFILFIRNDKNKNFNTIFYSSQNLWCKVDENICFELVRGTNYCFDGFCLKVAND